MRARLYVTRFGSVSLWRLPAFPALIVPAARAVLPFGRATGRSVLACCRAVLQFCRCLLIGARGGCRSLARLVAQFPVRFFQTLLQGDFLFADITVGRLLRRAGDVKVYPHPFDQMCTSHLIIQHWRVAILTQTSAFHNLALSACICSGWAWSTFAWSTLFQLLCVFDSVT